jgi:hypothetical protein
MVRRRRRRKLTPTPTRWPQYRRGIPCRSQQLCDTTRTERPSNGTHIEHNYKAHSVGEVPVMHELQQRQELEPRVGTNMIRSLLDSEIALLVLVVCYEHGQLSGWGWDIE